MKLDTRKFGTILLTLGVSAWLPFLVLAVLGREPTLTPFLAVHLLGVVGGSRLRALSRPADQRRPRRLIWGRILIVLGVLAWAPWFYQKNLLGRELEIAPYLAFHLTGVLSGLALLLSGPAQRLWNGLISRPRSEESGV